MSSFTIQRRAVACCLGLLAGIAIHGCWPVSPMSFWIPVAIACVGLCIRHDFIVGFCLALALGFVRFDLMLPSSSDALLSRTGGLVMIEGVIQKARSYDALLHIDRIEGSPAASRSFVAFAKPFAKEGERWRVSCRLEKSGEGSEMRDRMDRRDRVFARCRGSVSAIKLHDAPSLFLPAILTRWRIAISQRITCLFPGDQGALLSGILYGDRGLSQEANAAFRAAGMTHLIAVSGSNIAIVVGLFVPFFLLLGYRRPWAIVLSGAAIFLFTIFVGASASVIRAAIMGWLAILGRVFGRKASATRLLLIAGSLMAFFDPYALLYDAGFALSFLATWGLIAWAQPIADALTRVPKVFGLREMISTTLAATFATFPFSSWAFGTISLAGLLTNVFAIPLTAFVMLWGAIGVVLGGLMPWLIFPASGGLRLLLWIANLGSSYPILQIAWRMPWWMCAACYVCGLLWWRRRLKQQPSAGEDRMDVWSKIGDNSHVSTSNMT